MMSATELPRFNAFLNATSATCLVIGYILIRKGNINAHRACMIAAATISAGFLVSYVIYHSQAGFTRFTGEGWIRVVYFSILIPHTILAMFAVAPLAIVTLRRAFKKRFDAHRKVARWTLPIWLFVSVTGVLVYWMLYEM